MGVNLDCISQTQAGAQACHPGVDRMGQGLLRELLSRVEDKFQPLILQRARPGDCSKIASRGRWGERGPAFQVNFFSLLQC